MKRWITVLIVLLVAANANACLTGWLLGTPTEMDNSQAELRARLGIQMEDEAKVGDVGVGIPEIGLQLDWVGRESDFSRLGVYGLLHLRSEDEAATWAGRPYMGYSVDLDVHGNDGDGSAYGPILGTRYAKIFVLEYQYVTYDGPLAVAMDQGDDEHKLYAGFSIRW